MRFECEVLGIATNKQAFTEFHSGKREQFHNLIKGN